MVSAIDSTSPVRIALVDDYDIVLAGLAHMLEPYRSRVQVVEIDANTPLDEFVDVALYDTFGQPESDLDEVGSLVDNPRARHVAVFSWNLQAELIAHARQLGVHGYLSKTLSAVAIVEAIERINTGELVFSDPVGRVSSAPGLDWPGRLDGITDRESEILALITQGRSNAEVAQLTHLSPNTVKSYIRSVYRKIGVSTRTQAVLYGVRHGFAPDQHRIDVWRAGEARSHGVERG